MNSLLLKMVAACLLGLGAVAAEPWRSELYPQDWTPDHGVDDRFLHDFSYAGYRQGETLPAKTVGKQFNVVTDFQADNSGGTDATKALQAAIAEAEKAGGVVFLPAGRYRCDGRLVIRKSGVILRGEGRETELVFTGSRGMSGKGHVSFQGKLRRGPDMPLARDGENRSQTVAVGALGDLSVGGSRTPLCASTI